MENKNYRLAVVTVAIIAGCYLIVHGAYLTGGFLILFAVLASGL